MRPALSALPNGKKYGKIFSKNETKRGGGTFAAYLDGARAHGKIRARAEKACRAGRFLAADPARAGARLARGGDGRVQGVRRCGLASRGGLDVQAACDARVGHLRRQRGRDARFGRQAPDAAARAHRARAGAEGLPQSVTARGVFGEPARRRSGSRDCALQD